MEFLDLKTIRVVDVSKYTTYKVVINAEEILSCPYSEVAKKLESYFNVNFEDKNVFFKIKLNGLTPAAKAEEFNAEDDFEVLCDLISSTVLFLNRTTEERTPEEKSKIMNTLPGKRWTMPLFVAERLNINYNILRQCGDFHFKNKAINIQIESDKKEFLYFFINEKEEKQETKGN